MRSAGASSIPCTNCRVPRARHGTASEFELQFRRDHPPIRIPGEAPANAEGGSESRWQLGLSNCKQLMTLMTCCVEGVDWTENGVVLECQQPFVAKRVSELGAGLKLPFVFGVSAQSALECRIEDQRHPAELLTENRGDLV